jgi:hypothetical protein
MTTISEQIRQDQEQALATVRRVAESLPGYTNGEMSGRMGADLPCASTQEQALTSPLLVPGGNASA